MDFELTPEQREIQAVAREFAAAEIEPNASDWDRALRSHRDLTTGDETLEEAIARLARRSLGAAEGVRVSGSFSC